MDSLNKAVPLPFLGLRGLIRSCLVTCAVPWNSMDSMHYTTVLLQTCVQGLFPDRQWAEGAVQSAPRDRNWPVWVRKGRWHSIQSGQWTETWKTMLTFCVQMDPFLFPFWQNQTHFWVDHPETNCQSQFDLMSVSVWFGESQEGNSSPCFVVGSLNGQTWQSSAGSRPPFTIWLTPCNKILMGVTVGSDSQLSSETRVHDYSAFLLRWMDWQWTGCLMLSTWLTA